MTKTLWWILGSLLVIALIGAAFWFGLNYKQGLNLFKNAGSSRDANSADPKTDLEKIDQNLSTNSADKDLANGAEEAQNGPDWAIFKNFTYKYLIEYPKTATVENTGTDQSKDGKIAREAKCVKISTKYVHVLILARNVDPTTECLATGFGTEWGNSPDEQIKASGADYTAKGMHTEAASAGYYKDEYIFTTASGEKIQYGISVNERYDDQMTKTQAKALVHKIVASFNPAE